MLSLAIFDMPTRSSSGFVYRSILPRTAPPPLMGPFARNPFFSHFINNSDFVLATGHGQNNEMTGQGEQSLWVAGQYDPKQTQNKVIKLLSCDTGMELCPDLVQYGKAQVAMGYDQDYLWICDPSYYFHPWDDPLAAQCLQPVISGLSVLLNGGTALESLNTEKNGYLENMTNTDSELMFSILKWNYDHTVMFGDENATVSNPGPNVRFPFPPPPLLF